MGESLAPPKRRLLANFNCQPVLHHIRHGSRMSIASCGMWALQSVLDDMLRRILLLSINDSRVTTRRYVFGQDPPVPYPILVLHRPGCEELSLPALWKRRKPAVKFYGLVVKHSAPIFQNSDSFGFISHAGKFWIPPAFVDHADADDEFFSDQEFWDEESGSDIDLESSNASGVAVEAIRLVPMPQLGDSFDDDENVSGWFWENDSGDLVRYQMIEQAQLEAAFQSYQADKSLVQFPLTIAAHPDRRYIVDFHEMIQVNLDTQNARVILNQIRQDISLPEMFVSLKEAERVSVPTVRLLSKFDEPSEICSASWHASVSSCNTITIVHEADSITFFVRSVAFKERALTWEFEVCIASNSKLEDSLGMDSDAGGLHMLLRDVHLEISRNPIPFSACFPSAPVALSDIPPSAEAVCHTSTSVGASAQDIEQMSDEEQLMLALALSSGVQKIESPAHDSLKLHGVSAVVSSSLELADECGRLYAVEDAPHSLPQSDATPELHISPDPISRESGICCCLKFLIPFDICTSLPSASAEVNICVGDHTAPLGTLRFEQVVCEEEDRQQSDLELCTTSTILECFRTLNDNGEFIDEQVDLSSIPALVGGHSLLDHEMVDNAVKKILSQELLVSCHILS
jgi:hypothetical protein